jgi:transcriptional regulator with XRE-family HTH domain
MQPALTLSYHWYCKDMASSERQVELGRFLRDRRARVQPADVGLPGGARRRVAGLRREEVALLAGVGISWYTMLENGSASGVSQATLTAIAQALQLSAGETDYLVELGGEARILVPFEQPDPLTRAALDAIATVPAYICTAQWLVPAWNAAMSLVWDIGPPGGTPFNIVERMFLDPKLRAMHGDRFEAFARSLVAMVRSGAGRRIDDPEYRRMYEALRADAVFRAAWDGYEIATPAGTIATRVTSAAVGDFAYEALTLSVLDDAGYFIVMQVPDEPSAARLRAALAP